MRRLALFSLASFAVLSVAACGTAPDGTEKSASEGQELIIPRCPVGEQPECSGDGPQGQEICTCVPMPPVCKWVVPAYNADSYIQSWAVASPSGACPDVPGTNGTWKNLQPVTYANKAFDGVPCEIAWPAFPLKTCSQDFPGQACCTYVWWPAGFVAPSTQVSQTSLPAVCSAYPQDRQALCKTSGTTFDAILSGMCDLPDGGYELPDGGFDPGCGGGGGASCNTCMRPGSGP